MSRSKRRTPITGNSMAESEKQDKRIANRTLRAHVRTAMAGCAELMPDIREISDRWVMDKDGRHWFDPQTRTGQKMMRK